jgi:hypothetical protein
MWCRRTPLLSITQTPEPSIPLKELLPCPAAAAVVADHLLLLLLARLLLLLAL